MEELLKNEFQFYSKLAKPLVLNLPKSKDRILAAAWIKKFRNEEAGSENLRTIYLKLLLFCLQRRKLIGIFADDPTNYDVLEQLPEDIDLNEFARNLLAQDRDERTQVIRLEMMGDMETFPAYTTDCSPDLTEYVAAQDIPNFGVHAFYAISKQPVNKWQRSENAVLPKGAKSAIETSIAAATVTAASGCPCPAKGTASAPEVEEAVGEGDERDCRRKNKESEKKKRRPKKFGTSPPTHPIGEVRHPAEERLTPTWGTNLMQVHEQTDIGKIDEASDEAKALDEEISKMMEQEFEEEQEEAEDNEDVASMAEEMVHVLDEFKHGKMDKAKKPPSRLAKLGDRSLIKAPKSIKEPKIAVRGMKKNKDQSYDQFGEDFEGTHGGVGNISPCAPCSSPPALTEDEEFEMRENMYREQSPRAATKGSFGPRPANLPEEFADWTEKDLKEAGLTWADLMPVEENIDEELQRIEDEAMADIEEEDIPIEEAPFEEFEYDAMIREAEADLAMQKTIYDEGVEEDEPVVELFDDEFEDIHDQFNISRTAEEMRTASPAMVSGIPVTTPQRSASPRRFRSPERLFAQEDDELLQHRQSPMHPPKERTKKTPRTPKRSRSPPEPTNKDLNISRVFKKAKKVARERLHERSVEDEEEFERLEQQFEAEVHEAPGTSRMRTPSPARRPVFSPGDAERVRQIARQQEQLLRTPDQPYDQFGEDFEGPHDSLGNISPCVTCGSPPALTEDEEFEMRENMYREQSPRAAIPPNVYQTPPRRLPTQQEQEHQREQVLMRARQQEAMLRHGSPEANAIIQEAERSFAEDIFRREVAERQRLQDESVTKKVTGTYGPEERPEGYQSPSTSPKMVYGPMERPRTYTTPDMLELDDYPPGLDQVEYPDFSQLPEESPCSASPCLDFPGLEYENGLDTVQPPDFDGQEEFYGSPNIYSSEMVYEDGLDAVEPQEFEQLPEDSPQFSAPCTPSRPLQRSGRIRPPSQMQMKPRQLFAEETQGPCGTCGAKEPTKERSRPRRRKKRSDRRSPGDDFEEMERRFEMEDAGVPPRGRPLPDLRFSPGEADRVRQRAREQENRLRMPSPTPEDAEFERLERQFEMEETSLPCGARQRMPQREFSPADIQRVRDRAQQQQRLLMQDSPSVPAAQQRPSRAGTPTRRTRRQFDELDRRKVISPMPCPQTPVRSTSPVWSTPEYMPGPSRRPTGKTPPVYDSDNSPPPTPTNIPLRFAPAKRMKKRGRQPQPPASPRDDITYEGDRNLGPDQIPYRTGGPCQSPRRSESPRRTSPSTDLETSGYEENFRRILEANIRVPPEQYPPPERKVCAGARKALAPSVKGLGGFDVEKERQLEFSAAAQRGNLFEHLAQRDLEDIADQADLMFDYEGGLLDTSPPPDDLDRNYYPDIQDATRDLIRTLQDYGLPESPEGPPCRSPPRVPSRSPHRIPSPQVIAAAPCSEAVIKKPSERRIPQKKQLRETRSSQLRKANVAKLQQAEKEAQLKKEKAAKAAAQKKIKAQEKRKAEAEAKRREEAKSRQDQERASRAIPGERMRPPDYRLAKGTIDVAVRSAQKEVYEEREGQVDERIRRNLFGQQTSALPGQLGQRKGARTKRLIDKRLPGSKRPGDPRTGPEFMKELREHEVQFPGYREDVVVKGRLRQVPRRSQEAFRQMDYIEEEEGSPCGTCEGEGEEVERDIARPFDNRFLEEMEEVDEEEGAVGGLVWPNANEFQNLDQRAEATHRTSPVLTQFEEIERAAIRREQEERRYFERSRHREIQPTMEFEELDQAAIEAQARTGAIRKYYGRPRPERRKTSRRSTCPAEGVTYSPPRPRAKFGPPPYQPPAKHLPPASPRRSPPRSVSPGPPTPPSPPPLAPEMEYLDAVEPPVFYDMDEEDRLPSVRSPCARSPPRRTPSPQTPERLRQQIASMARPEFDPTLRGDLRNAERRTIREPRGMSDVEEEEPLIPCLAGMQPVRVQRDVRGRRRREPEQRRRRHKKGPVEDPEVSRLITGLEQKFNLPPEEEPEQEEYHVLDESLPPDLPSPLQPCQQSLISPPRMLPIRRITRQPWQEPSPPRSTLPFTPPRYTQLYVPPEDVHVHPDLLDVMNYEPPLEVPEGVDMLEEQEALENMYFTPPRYPETDEMEANREAARGWQAPWTVQRPWFVTTKDMRMQTPPSVGRGPCRTYTPTATPPLGLLDESVLEGMDDAMLMTPPGAAGPYQEELDRFFMPTPPLENEAPPQELQCRTRRAEGRERIRPISPPTPGTPPPQLPELCPQWSPNLDEFERLENEAEEATRRRHRKRPKAQLDFEERNRRAMIDEMAEESERMLMMSPEHREFYRMEQQLLLEEERGRRGSRRRRRRNEFEEIQRRAAIEEMALEAERVQMEYARAPSPRTRRANASPSKTPPPRMFQEEAAGPCGTCGAPVEPNLGQLYAAGPIDLLDEDADIQAAIEGYQSPEPLSQSWGDQVAPCASPVLHMDEEGVTRRMLNEMVFDPHAYPLEEPRSPRMLDEEQDMQAAIEGYESPEPLSRSWREQAGACGPCGSPAFDMNQDEMQQRTVEDDGFDHQWEEARGPQMLDRACAAACHDPYDYPLEDPRSPQMLDQEMMYDALGGYQTPPPLSPPRRQRCTEAEEARRQQYIERERQEIRQMFGPSPGPPSPGPDADFYANVYAHHVPQTFRAGDRPRSVLRGQIGTRRPPSMDPIAEQRARMLSPEQPQISRGARPRSAPTRGGVSFPSASRLARSQQATPSGSVQRIAEARQRSQPQSLTRRQPFCPGGQREQEEAAGVCPGAVSRFDAAEAQKRAKERLRARRRQEETASPVRTGRAPSREPPTQQPRDFMPRQVQRQRARTGGEEPQREEPRRCVRRTSSTKKIVTKKN